MAIIRIEFCTDNAAFEDDFATEVRRVLEQATWKVCRQMNRSPGCMCTAPESDDKLLDTNGNTCGKVEVSDG